MNEPTLKILTVTFLRTIAAITLIGTGLYYFLKTDLGQLIFRV